MDIIISPAKQMKPDYDTFYPEAYPQFLPQTKTLLAALKTLSPEDRQKLWAASDKLSAQAEGQLAAINFKEPLTPAVLAYVGVQYQAMAPDLFTEPALQYISAHLKILSGFYGVLRPFDGIVPYRLEMGAKLAIGEAANLYEFWGPRLHDALTFPVLNLASVEYAKAVRPYLTPAETMIDVVFGHLVNGVVKTRATKAKLARGAMVRYIAEHQLSDPASIVNFDHPRYHYAADLSTPTKFVFLTED